MGFAHVRLSTFGKTKDINTFWVYYIVLQYIEIILIKKRRENVKEKQAGVSSE